MCLQGRARERYEARSAAVGAILETRRVWLRDMEGARPELAVQVHRESHNGWNQAVLRPLEGAEIR